MILSTEIFKVYNFVYRILKQKHYTESWLKLRIQWYEYDMI